MANTKKKKKPSKLPVIFFVLIFIAGLSLLLYPTVSTLWNNIFQSTAIVEYGHVVTEMSEEEKQAHREAAQKLNELIYARALGEDISEEEIMELHMRVLDIDGKGMMGVLSIPKINVRLPIRHTTREDVLLDAVGHLEGTSLPIGGPGTHCALSGHTGLPRARLLTDLDQLHVGDYFVLEVLGENLYYQVDQVNVVLPYQASLLAIEPEMDLCTLITCTPYGINSHRLLVRGVRVITDEPIPDEVLAAGNPDYVPVLEPFPNDVPLEQQDADGVDGYQSGDLSGLTFNRNMPWWLRNVYTPIYIAVGAVLLLLAGLILPGVFRRRKKKKQEAEGKAESENTEETEIGEPDSGAGSETEEETPEDRA